MNAEEKLKMIRDVCRHPGSFHWSGREMADLIAGIVDDADPIPYRLSDADEPIRYELIHDAIYEGEQ